MLKNMPLDIFKDKLVAKYKYSEDFAQTIAHVTESLVDYHGAEFEDIICNAVLNCQFIVAKSNDNKPADTVQETKKKNGLDGGVDSMPTSDARSQLSEFVVEPMIAYRANRFELDGIKRGIILNANFSSDSMDSIGLLVGEMEKLIKNYNSGVELSGGSLVIRNGLATTRYKLSYENGEVSKRQTSSVGAGLEDGMTEYARLAIMNTSYDNNYGPTGYNDTRIAATVLAESIGLKDTIFAAEMSKDIRELKSKIDEHMDISYDDFVALLDKSYKLNASINSHIEDSKKVATIRGSIAAIFASSIAPSLEGMEKHIQESLENSKNKSL